MTASIVAMPSTKLPCQLHWVPSAFRSRDRLEQTLGLEARDGHTECMLHCRRMGAMGFDRALHAAAEFGHLDSMRLARTWGATQLRSAFMAALRGGQPEAARLVLEWTGGAENRGPLWRKLTVNKVMGVAISSVKIECMRIVAGMRCFAGELNAVAAMCAAARVGFTDGMLLARSWYTGSDLPDIAGDLLVGTARLQFIPCMGVAHSWGPPADAYTRALRCAAYFIPCDRRVVTTLLDWGALADEVFVELIRQVMSNERAMSSAIRWINDRDVITDTTLESLWRVAQQIPAARSNASKQYHENYGALKFRWFCERTEELNAIENMLHRRVWRRAHLRIADATRVLWPLDLPLYVLLEILDWTYPFGDALSASIRRDLIVKVRASIRRLPRFTIEDE